MSPHCAYNNRTISIVECNVKGKWQNPQANNWRSIIYICVHNNGCRPIFLFDDQEARLVMVIPHLRFVNQSTSLIQLVHIANCLTECFLLSAIFVILLFDWYILVHHCLSNIEWTGWSYNNFQFVLFRLDVHMYVLVYCNNNCCLCKQRLWFPTPLCFHQQMYYYINVQQNE